MPTIQSVIFGAIATIFLGLGLVILLQHHRISEDQIRYEQLLKDSSSLQAANQSWKNISETQNRKLRQLAEQQRNAEKRIAKALVAAKIKTRDYENLAAKIAAFKTSNDDCLSANAVKDFYLKNRK